MSGGGTRGPEPGRGSSGAVLVDKPEGPTSFDVVRAVRRACGTRRVGHTGTLDPMATGLLVLCVAEATKLVPFLVGADKEYLAAIRLGIETDTLDAAGAIVAERPVPPLDPAEVAAALDAFRGTVRQRPPVYSALKKDGVAYHRRARRGYMEEPAEREVRIDEIELLDWTPPVAKVRIRCGKGTYVRSVARDLGRALGSGAHLSALQRTRVGRFRVEDAQPLGQIQQEGLHLVEPAALVADLPRAIVAPAGEERLRHGLAVSLGDLVAIEGLAERMRVLDERGALVAIAASRQDGLWPLRILAR